MVWVQSKATSIRPDQIETLRRAKTSHLIGLLVHPPEAGGIAWMEAIADEIDRRIPVPDPRIGKLLKARVEALRATYGARPPWWRPIARRRWNRWMAGVEQRAIDRMRSELADDGQQVTCAADEVAPERACK